MTSSPACIDFCSFFSDFLENDDMNNNWDPYQGNSQAGSQYDGFEVYHEQGRQNPTVFKASELEYSMRHDDFHGQWDDRDDNNKSSFMRASWDCHDSYHRTRSEPYQRHCMPMHRPAYSDENEPSNHYTSVARSRSRSPYYHPADHHPNYSYRSTSRRETFSPQPFVEKPNDVWPPRVEKSYSFDYQKPYEVEDTRTPVVPSPNRSKSPEETRTLVLPSHDKNKGPGALQDLDIVCGRGAPTNYHYGNKLFRELVEDYQTKYLCAKRSDKAEIAMKVLDIVKSRGSRFVRRQKAAGRSTWEPIEDKSAYEKVCQALREGAPNLQRQVLSNLAR